MKKRIIAVSALCASMLFTIPVFADITSQLSEAESILGIDNSDQKTVDRITSLEEELGLSSDGLSISERVSAIEAELGIDSSSVSENESSTESITEDVTEQEMQDTDSPSEDTLAYAPTDEFVMDRLSLISSIKTIAAVTEDHDPNGQLNKSGGYIGCIYFYDEQVSEYATDDEYQVIENGTIGGGAIEIFSTVEDAESRRDYLAAYDGTMFSNGSHEVVGTCLVRTSDDLTASQQNNLTEEIRIVLTAADINTIDLSKYEAVTDSITAAIEAEELNYVLYDQDGYTITCTGYDAEGQYNMGPQLTLKFQNLTHHDINVNDTGSYVNGQMIMTDVIIPGLEPTPAAVQRSLTAHQPICPNPHFSPC